MVILKGKVNFVMMIIFLCFKLRRTIRSVLSPEATYIISPSLKGKEVWLSIDIISLSLYSKTVSFGGLPRKI